VSEPTTIRLCGEEVTVAAQREAYLLHHFKREISGMFVELEARVAQFLEGEEQQGFEHDDNEYAEVLLTVVRGHEYDALCKLIPGDPVTEPGEFETKIPRWRWEGYRSEQAMLDEDYDPSEDLSPTEPDKLEAFKTLSKINRLDLLAPKLLAAFFAAQEAATAAIEETVSQPTTSAKSPSAQDGSDRSTSSGTEPPTLELRQDSPFPVFTG
jgi:hypothetical protein